MKPVLAWTLIGSLLFSTASVSAAGPDGPIARAIASEASRLAAQDSASVEKGRWRQVREIAAATEVTVTLAGDAEPVHRVFVSADDAHLLVLNLTDPSLPKAAVRGLKSLAERYAASLEHVLDRPNIIDVDDIKVGPDGVFVGMRERRKVAEVSDVLQRVSSKEVLEIDITQRRGGAPGAALGAALGVPLGLLTMLWLSCDCGRSNDFTRGLAVSALFAVPTATSILGYHASVRTETTVVYRATPGL